MEAIHLFLIKGALDLLFAEDRDVDLKQAEINSCLITQFIFQWEDLKTLLS